MKNTNNERSSINLYIQTEQRIDTQLNLFQGMPKTIRSISRPMSRENQNNSIDSLQKNSYQGLPTNHPFLPQTNSQYLDPQNQPSIAGGINLVQFSQTVNMLKSKKQKLKSRRIRKPASEIKKQVQEEVVNEKILRICKNFISKIRRNNIFSPAVVNEDDLDKYFQHEEPEGVQMSISFIFFYKLFTTISIISLILCQTFVFVFPQLAECTLILIVLIMSAISFAFMIMVNLFAIRRINGKRITKLTAIAKYYIKQGDFFVDIFTLVMILIQFKIMQSFWIDVILITLIFKIGNLMQKLSNLQQMIVKSYYYQRYWSLLKIIIFNFVFAHVIAILLNLMANQYPQKNWQTVKGISDSPWYQRYVWSYYWATTVMLTVGFGDIVPSIYQQAIWVTFIEIISCIAFSYNISCLGNLIGNIRAQGQQIEKNRKIFQVMDNKIGFSEQLFDKVEHYINESVNIKSKFNIAEEKNFIENLPQSYKRQVKCESNKKLLKPLPFFSCLLTKTIFKLATSMERYIYYPQEIIKPIESQFAIYVLESGKIGCICKKYDSSYNGIIANVIKITDKDPPFLFSQEFITNKKLSYEIKSLGYSVVHKLNFPQFIQTLKGVHKDYEYYTFLRDKAKSIIDQYQTIKCDLCTTNHSYFDCPKYHYLPIKENIVRKQLKKYNQSKNNRSKFIRSEQRQQNTLTKLTEYEEAVRLILNAQIANNSNKKMTNNQLQMRKFLVNIYNFDQIANQRTNVKTGGDIIKTFKSLMGVEEWGQPTEEDDDFQWIWDTQFERAANYDIYFPADNSNKLQSKFDSKQKIKKMKDISISRKRVLTHLSQNQPSSR